MLKNIFIFFIFLYIIFSHIVTKYYRKVFFQWFKDIDNNVIKFFNINLSMLNNNDEYRILQKIYSKSNIYLIKIILIILFFIFAIFYPIIKFISVFTPFYCPSLYILSTWSEELLSTSSKNNKLALSTQTKLYWDNIFVQEKINHPKIVGKIINKKFYNYDMNPFDYYILKPNISFNGSGIKKIKLKDVNKSLMNNEYIIQELLTDCYVNGSRHFRFITLYTGKKFMLHQQKSENECISNSTKNNYIKSYCDNYECKELTKDQNIKLNIILTKLSELHQRRYKYIFSIGWDIVINCHNNNFDYYVLEGNLGCGWLFKEMPMGVKKLLITEYLKNLDNFNK